MPRCPVCESQQVSLVLNGTREGVCLSCGATWVQDGGIQRGIRAPDQSAGAR
ncbi:MAG TPA: hypothetical protein VGB51_07195 [Actinomycetota bacterium]